MSDLRPGATPVPGQGPVEALRDPELELRAIFDHALQFIGLLSKDGVLLEVNRAALDFIGKERSAVVGRAFWEGAWWAHLPQARQRVREAISEAARGQRVRYEVDNGGAGGRRATLDFSLTPVKGPQGEVVLLVAEARDVTERKELERQREEWTSIVAHDLRQPVNNLNLWLGVLERQALRAGYDLTDGFEHARASIKQLDRMISDLLDASQLEGHRPALQRCATDLALLVRGVLERTDPDLRARVSLQPHEELAPIEVDPARIEQVLTNLLLTSVKYGDPGTPISVELAGAPGEVRVAVVNQGRGLSPEDDQQLFHRFRRAPQGRAGEIAGLGLGMYVTRSLVEAHGGQIWVERSAGETTAFRFTLARAAPNAAEPVRWIPRLPAPR